VPWQLARCAVAALIEEAQLTPKPALVDRRGSGAHRDLDLPKMLRSAQALRPTFEALAYASLGRAPSQALREELARIGRAGEEAMMRATGNSNAHRGAIWVVGLMVAGAAMGRGGAEAGTDFGDGSGTGTGEPPYAEGYDPHEICATAARLARFDDRYAPPIDSHGARVRRLYGAGGARHEAQEGFAHVIAIALPALQAARAAGVREDCARLDALLAIIASLEDTCLLHRAGEAGLAAAQHGARNVFAQGGTATAAGRAALVELERVLLALNASPGGAADLLAATLFLDKLARAGAGGTGSTWNN
jgi:triphosphoribosyl-dephospho-CoA synthase